MPPSSVWILVACGAVPIPVLGQCPEDAAPVATLAFVLGDVRLRRAGTDFWIPASRLATVCDGDVVRTGPGGLARLAWTPAGRGPNDVSTVLNVGGQTEVDVGALLGERDDLNRPRPLQAFMEVIRGTIRGWEGVVAVNHGLVTCEREGEVVEIGDRQKATLTALGFDLTSLSSAEWSPMVERTADIPGEPPLDAFGGGDQADFGGEWHCRGRGWIRLSQSGAQASGSFGGAAGEHWGTGERAGGTVELTVSGQTATGTMWNHDGTRSEVRITRSGGTFSGTFEWFRGTQRLDGGNWGCSR